MVSTLPWGVVDPHGGQVEHTPPGEIPSGVLVSGRRIAQIAEKT
jgi:hypothetical protein